MHPDPLRPRLIIARSGRVHAFAGVAGLVLLAGLALGGVPGPGFGAVAGTALFLAAAWSVAVGVTAMGRVDPKSPEVRPALLWWAAPGWLGTWVTVAVLTWIAWNPFVWHSIGAAQWPLKYAACALPPLAALLSTWRAATRFRAAIRPGAPPPGDTPPDRP